MNNLAFVVSAPRSGSTWLTTALNAHPSVCCTENRFFGQYFDVVEDICQNTPRLRVTLDRYVEALLQSFYGDHLATSVEKCRSELMSSLSTAVLQTARQISGKTFIVDKVTPYAGTAGIVVEQISSEFPDAPIIGLIRDGRDVLTSGVFHWITKRSASTLETEFSIARREAILSGSRFVFQRFFTDEEIDEWSRHWMDPVEALWSNPRIKWIRYEDMSEDLTSVLRELLHGWQLDVAPNLLDRCKNLSAFEKMSGGRTRGQADLTAHVRKGIVGDWRNWFTRADGKMFDQIAGKILVRSGYVSGRNWWHELPEQLKLSTIGSELKTTAAERRGKPQDAKRTPRPVRQVKHHEPTIPRKAISFVGRTIHSISPEFARGLRERLGFGAPESISGPTLDPKQRMEGLLELVAESAEMAWLYRNRLERMDATIDQLFDTARRKFHLARYEFAVAYADGKDVVDIASGTGYGAAILKARGAQSVVGVDIDPEAVEYATRIHAPEGVSYINAPGETTGLPASSCDVVVSFETIEHVPDDSALLSEFHRILRPNGILVCSTPNEWPLEVAPFHTRVYNRNSFEASLLRHFATCELWNQNSGTDSEFNHGQPAGIVATDSGNAAKAECYIAVARKQG